MCVLACIEEQNGAVLYHSAFYPIGTLEMTSRVRRVRSTVEKGTFNGWLYSTDVLQSAKLLYCSLENLK